MTKNDVKAIEGTFMAATLREALEDERKELGIMIKDIEYIQERIDRMINVAKALEEMTGELTNG